MSAIRIAKFTQGCTKISSAVRNSARSMVHGFERRRDKTPDGAFVSPHLALPGCAGLSRCRRPLIDARRCLVAQSDMQLRRCPKRAYRIFALVQCAHAFDFDSDRVLERGANGARRARAPSLAKHAVGSLSGIQLDGLLRLLPRSMTSSSCLRGHQYGILAHCPDRRSGAGETIADSGDERQSDGS